MFMKVDCADSDLDMLADVFNGETWTKISGIQLELEDSGIPEIPGDPWVEDPFEG